MSERAASRPEPDTSRFYPKRRELVDPTIYNIEVGGWEFTRITALALGIVALLGSLTYEGSSQIYANNLLYTAVADLGMALLATQGLAAYRACYRPRMTP